MIMLADLFALAATMVASLYSELDFFKWLKLRLLIKSEILKLR